MFLRKIDFEHEDEWNGLRIVLISGTSVLAM
jgi:hypothetical protein